MCDATEDDEGEYECCAEVEGALDCVKIDLVVLAICQDEDGNEYTVSPSLDLVDGIMRVYPHST